MQQIVSTLPILQAQGTAIQVTLSIRIRTQDAYRELDGRTTLMTSGPPSRFLKGDR